MCSRQEGIKNPHHVELNSAEEMPKTMASDSVTDVLSSEFSCGKVYSSVVAPPNALSTEEMSSSKQSCSAVESNSQGTSLIDLKLGRFPDPTDAQTRRNPNLSSVKPSKRARAGSLSSQMAFCQVQGCKKDLSASKDYNKRHKVCEVHTKTATVNVNGSQQRFCQQCSRFHLLAEFDDGKRSCRKRLAGHNERRRKHHVGMHSGRAGRLIQPHSGSRFPAAAFALSSFSSQGVLQSSHLYPQKYEMSSWNRNVTDYAAALGMRNIKEQAHTKSHMDTSNSNNKCHPMHEDRLIPLTGGKVNDPYNSFTTSVSTTGFDSLSLYQNTTVESEELNALDSPSNVQGLPPSSSSSCALFLLSSESQTSPKIPSRSSTSLTQITCNAHPHYSIVDVSDKLMRASPQNSTCGMSHVFSTSGVTSAEETHTESLLFTDSMRSDRYGYNEFIPGSAEFTDTKNQLSAGDDSTIDLLELSSQLHRVEHERQSMQLKQENDPFFGLRMT